MKCICLDLRRALAGRWFLAALMASLAALIVSLGDDAYYLLNYWREPGAGDCPATLPGLLLSAMQGDFGVMTLPALSALPYAAQALLEIRCGAFRPALFRAGRRSWIAGKALACLLSGMALQGAAALCLALLLHGLMGLCAGRPFPPADMAPAAALLRRRMLCGGLWASLGCLAALLTDTASAAYLAPLCLCYAMVMLSTRFFPQAPLLNPAAWLTGSALPLAAGLALLTAALLLILHREVASHV